MYDVFGFFRFIENLAVFNLPKDEPKPSMPGGNIKMELQVRVLSHSCVKAKAQSPHLLAL